MHTLLKKLVQSQTEAFQWESVFPKKLPIWWKKGSESELKTLNENT